MLAHFFAALAFAYLGMLALCQGLDRHYKQVWGKPPSPRLSRLLRVSGWVSLGLGDGAGGLARHAFVERFWAADAVAVQASPGRVVADGICAGLGGDRNPDVNP